MALVSPHTSPHFGVRCVTMFTGLEDSSIAQSLQEDRDVQIWLNAFKRDPVVRLTSGVLNESQFYLRTALTTSSAILSAALYPITKPLSYFVKPNVYSLTPCPFPAAQKLKISGRGDIAIKKLGIIDRTQLFFDNVANSIAVSRNPLIKYTWSGIKTVITFPLRIVSEPSKESLVLTTVRQYFPSFETAKFVKWMEESFLPVFMERYIKGFTLSLKEVAMINLVQERQMSIADIVMNRLTIRSKLLQVYGVEVLEFDFKARNPIIIMKFYADQVEHMINQEGQTVIGGPQNVVMNEYMVSMTIDDEGDHPVWKAQELHSGLSARRI